MEMLVKMAEVLVKIAVMMMAPGSAPAPPEARGREAPFFLLFLDLLPRWEKGFPSGPCLPWLGRGESPSEIGSISLSLSISALLWSAFSPFRIYMEIRNSDWIETFAHLYSVVHSPATRWTLYLNMVLYASYYYPMMCCHPMMSE